MQDVLKSPRVRNIKTVFVKRSLGTPYRAVFLDAFEFDIASLILVKFSMTIAYSASE